MRYSYNMSLEDISKAAVTLGKRSASVRNDTHKVLISVLARWLDNGNVQVIRDKGAEVFKFCDPYYKQAIVDWLAVHAGLDYDQKNEAFHYTKTTITQKEVEAAKADPFWECSPAKVAQAFDFNAKLAKLIADARKRVTSKKKMDTDVIDLRLIAALEGLAATFSKEEQPTS